MLTLNEVNEGQKVIIADIKGNTRFLSRITSIGLTLGCEIKMLYNEKKFPLLFYGRDTVIALNREESNDVFVEEIA
ncbi:MAG TPA: ferrous iron transport protein A [Petrimonas sp.]|jgi:ferrous iron transport protein A|nr:ferrous iron transport protein A [Petrimonas sp.]